MYTHIITVKSLYPFSFYYSYKIKANLQMEWNKNLQKQENIKIHNIYVRYDFL